MVAKVTKLGDLLDLGQLFKAFGTNYFAKISNIVIVAIFVKVPEWCPSRIEFVALAFLKHNNSLTFELMQALVSLY